MSTTTVYLGKLGTEDCWTDASSHSITVGDSVTKSVNGLASVFHRIDGTGDTGTGDWLTTGKMTGSYFVGTNASTYSDLPKLLASSTLRVGATDGSNFEADASSVDIGVATNISGAVALTGGATANTLLVSTSPTGSETLRAKDFRAGATALTSTLTVAGATTLSSSLAVAGTATFVSAVTLNGSGNSIAAATTLGAALTVSSAGSVTLQSGSSLTMDSGSTLAVNGTMTLAELAIASAAGSEKLRTTTFRATGASTIDGALTCSSTISVTGAATLNSTVSLAKVTTVASGGQFVTNGVGSLWALPITSDTGTSATLDLDALATRNSHTFAPSSGTRAITTVSNGTSGVYWFMNAHASNSVTIATGYMGLPTGTFTLAAGERALLYWDNDNDLFYVVSHD